ncbi:filamentous hemagglutinin N-terminal domain-containing protein [Aetokthonos hydrillicola Thurmond2011]|jgi:filamentous hemagglutinin family protein|uniref:Filamentous hemagglutinin N-terminal domain-containing protein n=1 Tax=Aetokthonos hydrillicola Thurmond2011 TaxID=2712845 RepID=A0AAP5M8N6_9CYAN|nr:filamentous hemagglutinin N-terminal domain-containing protein [Aetokthonos hydrillicola]MBO3459588.1 filamentous hemagglutinin N-terminal domain-containing protein [Aetokthonos hydrillicola CCALA 1050]MBW4590954.1 filamentous hemagglutinin N-terminal domain-containing protein [Aetokthonos hydrillicola CCALA 1050]MDR9899376.1 filamentous hemagglutinin N-terminal domain-containing protein [Aetokthonos hydrillicola Thurmond2011]
MASIWRWLLGSALSSACTFVTSSATAQITPDTSLPNNSTVTIDGSTFNIRGGTQAGRNLFHSFQQFSVPTGSTASFNNGLDVQNIFSRVTGGSVSNINGIIKANGTANLFLLNPSGIVFGKNASLNVGGSFVATTANAIQFGNLGFFSASEPNNPAVLTINPTALFYNQISAASIQNNSTAPDTVAPTRANSFGLRVPDGKSLLLVGGDINIDGGRLNAYGGQVFLGGLATPGMVGLGVDGNNFSLSFPTQSTAASVSLLNGASVNVTAGGGGSITVNANNVNITGGSQLNAGIAQGLGNIGVSAGDININATGTVTINQASSISNTVANRARGDTGNINIQAGDIFINSITNTTNNTHLLETVNKTPLGRTGNISLKASGNISVTGQNLVGDNDGSVISTFGPNVKTGDISLNANGTISLNNAYFVTSNFRGDAGNISLQGNKSVSLANNSSLVATSFGRGNSGNITVESLSGSVSFQNSLVSTAVGDPGAIRSNLTLGNGGNINISGQSVAITDGAEISSRTFSGLSSGNIQITGIEQVEILGRAPTIPRPDSSRAGTYLYSTVTATSEQPSRGVAGDIKITTKNLRVADGGILRAESKNNARGGSIKINASSFELTGGGQLINTAFGKGDAGNIILNVKDSVFISGINPDKSILFKRIADDFTQKELRETRADGSPKYTPEQAKVDGIRHAQSFVDIDPNNPSASGIYANTSKVSTGKGGNVNIRTGQLLVRDAAQVTVSSLGSGNAGNVQVSADSIRLDNQGKLTAETASGQGGSITLTPNNLLVLRHSSQISTSAGRNLGGGNGGNITIDTPSGFIIAAMGENSDITANAFSASGGRVMVKAASIFGMVSRTRNQLQQLLGTTDPTKLDPSLLPTNDITAISQGNPSLNGTVTINTPDVDPSRGLVQLPAAPVNVQITQGCQASRKQSSLAFFNIGKGGVAPNPYEPQSSSDIWEDVPTTMRKTENSPPLSEIVPAKGWVFDGKGNVTLIPETSLLDSHSLCRLR